MANEEEPRDPEEERGGPEDELSQDPFVERLRPDPSEPPIPIRVLEGLLGSSDREGYWRLYFTRELDYYAEFRAEDVVYSEPIPPDQPPFLGQQATRVGIRRDATIEYTRVRTPRPVDEFDLDIRLGARGGWRGPRAIPGPETWEAECPGPTRDTCRTICGGCGGDTFQITICRGRTCIDVGTCDTCARTCDTCLTQCQDTCFTCGTCRTQCGQATCVTCWTCQTQCGQATCGTCPGQTCATQCGQPTCQVTCETCPRTRCECETFNPHVFTCGPNPQCF
jgi:hypothetical protein